MVDIAMMYRSALFDAVGGMPTFERLVGHFYAGVAEDPVLGPLYPKADLDGARQRLTLFLAQYWGGPDTYSRERGHPRLRMRHAPFAIGERERSAWMQRMTAAVVSLDLEPPLRRELLDYFEAAAQAMVNRPK